MSVAIQTDRLTKLYGPGSGCRGITLSVKSGQIFGFLGPNGAGKSTFVKMLVGLIRPDAGRAEILGLPLGHREIRRQIGYLPELFRYQDWLTAEEVLRFHAQLGGLGGERREKRIRRVLNDVGLAGRTKERVRHFSKGMQQRLGWACALLLDPPLLFLDEPSSALDPMGRHDMRQLLLRLRQEGKTIFLNTHLLEDVESVCDEVAFLVNGRIRAQGTVEALLHPELRWEFEVGGWEPGILEGFTDPAGISIQVVEADDRGFARLQAVVTDREQAGWINALLVEQGITVYASGPVQTHLEQWFLALAEGEGGEIRGSRDAADLARDPA